jgi:hypothetical protein
MPELSYYQHLIRECLLIAKYNSDQTGNEK